MGWRHRDPSAMSIFREVYNALKVEATAAVSTGLSIPLAFDNAEFTKPASLAPYVECIVNWDVTELHSSKGNQKRYRTEATITVSLFRQEDKGDGLLREWSAEVAEYFRRRSIATASTTIRMLAPSLVRVGTQRGYWRHNIQVPFEFEDTEDMDRTTFSAGQPRGEDAAAVLRSRFKTLIATPESLPTKFDNAKFDAPQPNPKVPVAWSVFSVRTGQEEVELSGGYFRTPGVAVTNLYWPVDAGTSRPMALADLVVSAFRSATDGGVSFQSPSLSRGGRLGPWWQINVRSPFYFESVAIGG